MDKGTKTKLYIEALPLTTSRVSGIGHMLASLVRAMAADDDFTSRYDIVLFGPRSGAARVAEWRFPGVTYRGQPVKQRFITLANFLGVLPAVDRWLGSGVYLFGNFTNFPLTKKSKSLTYVHDVYFWRYPDMVRPRLRRILGRNLPRWIKRADRVIAVSEYSKREIAAYQPGAADKIVVVPNGVDPAEFYKRPAAEIAAARAKYALPEKYALFLSNIEPRKNVERLVKAFAALPKELVDGYALVLIGSESWLDRDIEAAVAAAKMVGAKIIKPAAYVTDADLPAVISGAAVLAHPALYEGFGISPLQAMACGTPVLAAKATSLPEVLGEAALYADPLSAADISEKLARLLTDNALRQKLSAAGQKQALKFTWDNSLRRLKAVIAEVAP